MTSEPAATATLRAWLEYPISYGPAVSSDGKKVYFISSRGGIPQAWSVPLDGGRIDCVHPARENVGKLVASPKRPALLLSLDRGGNEHWQLFVREEGPIDPSGKVRPLTDDPAHIHEPGAWRDGTRFAFASNRRDMRFFDIYDIDTVRGGEPRLLRREDALQSVVAARGDRVLVNRSNTNLDSDLILVEETRESLLTPHSGELTVWAADLVGEDAIAGANPDREFAALVRYRPGAPAEILRETAGDVEVVKGDPEGNRVAYSVNRAGRSELHLLNLRTNEDRLVESPGIGVTTTLAWIPHDTGLVFDFSSPTLGCEVWRYDPDTRGLTPLTKSAVSMPGATVAPSLHAFRAEDGLEVPFWEYAPASEAERGTIIEVHGGPEGQARPIFGSGVYAFLVAQGWRVISPNVRGSTGYGRSYVHLDDVRKRMESVRDLRDLVRALASEGKAAPGRIGIFGGSYGGFMVLAAITTYPDLWTAAAEFYGIANFVTFLERTGPWRRKVREAEYGSLASDRDFLEAISPIHRVDRIVTPLLVAHGVNDVRVPVVEAEQIVDALRKRRIPVEFLRYEDEGHGFVRIENQVDSLSRTAEFFARHIAGPSIAEGMGPP